MKKYKGPNHSTHDKWFSFYLKGNSHYLKGNYFLAKKQFEKAVKITEDDTDLLNEYGFVLIELNQYDQAIKFLNKALKIENDYDDIWLNKGRAEYYKENYDNSIKSLKTALKFNPKNHDAFHFLGHCYQEKSQYKKSIDYFRKELKIYSGESHSWTELARSYYYDTDFTNSIKCSTVALRKDKKNDDALTIKGISLYLRGNLKNAEKHLIHAITLNKNNKTAIHYLGHIFYDLEDYKNSSKYFQKEISLGIEFEDTYLELGKSLHKLGKFKESIQILKKGIKESPDYDTWITLATSYASISDTTNSQKAFQKAKSIKKIPNPKQKDLNKIKENQRKYSKVINLKEKLVKPTKSKGVFVIHGHDEKIKKEIVSYLKRIGLRPFVLSDMPSGGQTLIEKLEFVLPRVGFAVVLFTPDDMIHEKNNNSKIARARQNVVLEYGMARMCLGRKNVCLMKKDSLEFPTDLNGVVYVNLDNKQKWKKELKLELIHAKMNVR